MARRARSSAPLISHSRPRFRHLQVRQGGVWVAQTYHTRHHMLTGALPPLRATSKLVAVSKPRTCSSTTRAAFSTRCVSSTNNAFLANRPVATGPFRSGTHDCSYQGTLYHPLPLFLPTHPALCLTRLAHGSHVHTEIVVRQEHLRTDPTPTSHMHSR
eukprot:COSAG01_NODE_3936_length_5515_cov_5.199889_1_plen_158_part_00